MTADQICQLLEMLGCRKIRVSFNRVMATCPEESRHTGGRDRNPSFSVLINETGASYAKCWACGFSGVLEKIARELGMKGFDSDDWDLARDRRRLGLVHQLGEFYTPNANVKHWGKEGCYYYDFLNESAVAPYMEGVPRYILNRGILLETARTWRIGSDRQYKRAIFVIRDNKGRLCGVSGRSTVEHKIKFLHYSWDIKNYKLVPFIDHRREQDFLRFNKSRFLFGEHLIEPGRGNLVVTEGHLDAVKVWQAGFNAVATMGTGFSEEQIERIKKSAPNSVCVVMFDNDKAGRIATEKLLEKLGSKGMFCKVAELPEDQDPGDMTDEEIQWAIQKAREI